MEEDDQDIYDDGTSITNRCDVRRITSMFEPAMQGPKPSLPSKPSAKPTTPKRNEDTKLTANGDVKLPPKNNVQPKRNIADIANKARDENSNVKNGNDINLNKDLVSKFNSITNSDSKLKPWEKPKPTDIIPKPLDSKVKPAGKLPIEGLASRVKMFEAGKQEENETKNNKLQISQSVKPSSIADAKAAIAGTLQPKLPTVNRTENKPIPTPVKPGNKQPPPTPFKPNSTQPPPTPIKPNAKSPTEHDKTFTPGKSKLIQGEGSQNELLQQLRKISMRKESESEQSDAKPMLRNRARTKSVKRKSLTRVADNKKFYIVEISNLHNDKSAPSKPPKISDIVNLEKIVSEFKRKISLPDKGQDQPTPQGVVEAVEDIYEELPGDDDEDFPPPPPLEVIPHSRASKVVSIIQPMTEEDELETDDVYDEGFSAPGKESPPAPIIPGRPPRRDLPDVPLSSVKEEPIPEPPPKPSVSQDTPEDDQESDGELYEPLDDVVQEVQKIKEEEKNANSNDNKTEQISEKERKKREKEEKKRLEQEKKLQERKMKELKSKFKIDPSDLEPENSKGTGLIKEDAKGKGKDLTVKKDQRVVIISMDKRNPKGKWLVKLDDESDTLGYVDSNNVEVDNTLIRSVMDGTYAKKSSFGSIPDDQEEYEAVEPEQDDVYSEAL